MRAATIRDGRIEVVEHPDPEPQDGQLLVRVRAAGLNGADMLQLAGRLSGAARASPADIPGLELAGEVVACGRRVGRFEPGDRVMAIVAGGGQAELAVVHERTAMPVPEELDWTAAGGVPEVFTTAHDALFTQAGLMVGERLLVHGAAGGVGMAAVQLGAMAGARVTATVRNEHAREQIAALGVNAIAPEGFVDEGQFDVILELVGAPNLSENLDALAIGGRICIIGVGAGPKTEIDLRKLMGKRGRIHGSTLRTRPIEEKAIAARLMEKMVSGLRPGFVRPATRSTRASGRRQLGIAYADDRAHSRSRGREALEARAPAGTRVQRGVVSDGCPGGSALARSRSALVVAVVAVAVPVLERRRPAPGLPPITDRRSPSFAAGARPRAARGASTLAVELDAAVTHVELLVADPPSRRARSPRRRVPCRRRRTPTRRRRESRDAPARQSDSLTGPARRVQNARLADSSSSERSMSGT